MGFINNQVEDENLHLLEEMFRMLPSDIEVTDPQTDSNSIVPGQQESRMASSSNSFNDKLESTKSDQQNWRQQQVSTECPRCIICNYEYDGRMRRNVPACIACYHLLNRAKKRPPICSTKDCPPGRVCSFCRVARYRILAEQRDPLLGPSSRHVACKNADNSQHIRCPSPQSIVDNANFSNQPSLHSNARISDCSNLRMTDQNSGNSQSDPVSRTQTQSSEQISCQICGIPKHNIHCCKKTAIFYCKSCYGFVRRTTLPKECKFGSGECRLGPTNRCSYCRYKRAIALGFYPDYRNSLMDGQFEIKSHETIIEDESQEGMPIDDIGALSAIKEVNKQEQTSINATCEMDESPTKENSVCFSGRFYGDLNEIRPGTSISKNEIHERTAASKEAQVTRKSIPTSRVDHETNKLKLLTLMAGNCGEEIVQAPIGSIITYSYNVSWKVDGSTDNEENSSKISMSANLGSIVRTDQQMTQGDESGGSKSILTLCLQPNVTIIDRRPMLSSRTRKDDTTRVQNRRETLIEPGEDCDDSDCDVSIEIDCDA